ncbi:MAG TPA: hypothetical protein VGA42_03995 [Gemmatimonadales bacterium]
MSSDLANPKAGDHEATWLFGHTQHITFRRLWRHEEDLFARATLHIPCRFLEEENGTARCKAHGFSGPAPAQSEPGPQPRRLGGDRFRLVQSGELAEQGLERPAAPKRRLAVLNANPCATAPCRTTDNQLGAACCRDLVIEIMCDRGWRRQELLIRSRKPPYLCKVKRDTDESLEAEIISACDYLDAEDRISCTLHGLRRPDGREAKPDLCRRWPKPTLEETLHRGCVFAKPQEPAAV